MNSNKESNNGGVTGSQGDVGGLVSDYFVIDSCIGMNLFSILKCKDKVYIDDLFSAYGNT